MTVGRAPLNTICILVLLAALAPAAARADTAATDKLVAAIRAQYEEIGARIAKSEAKKAHDSEATGIARTEVVINKDREPWRAVGVYRVVYTFWFQDGEPAGGGTVTQRLRKATVSVEVATRRLYQEFFYASDGALAFYFRRAAGGEAPGELRLYFDKQRPVRAIADGVARDTPNPEDLKAAPDALAKSAALKRLFEQSLRAPVE